MKILHTADWHLGAKTEGKSRLPEQRRIMDEIVKISDEENINLVIVAGDIFDQAVPTSEAEDLFYETLDKLTAGGDRVVIAIAGNHDDHKRLMAGVYFAKKHNAIIVGDLSPQIDKIKSGNMAVESLQDGSVDIKIKSSRGEQHVVVACLPYPAEYRFEEKAKASDYSGKVEEWARMVCKGFKKDSVNILVSHLMLVGSIRISNDKSAEVRVGDINAVAKSDLPKADYYALGHIHSFQNMKGNYCYSGAPIMLDFNQKSVGVSIVEIQKDGVRSVDFKPIESANKMVGLDVHNVDKIDELLEKFVEGDIVNLTFVQNEPLSQDFIKSLKQKYPCVVQVKLRRTQFEKDDINYVCDRTKLDSESLFVNFYKSRNLSEPDKDVVGLFKELMEDMSSETD